MAIERIRAAIGDQYDLSKVVYVRQRSEVVIICKQHGEFLKRPEILWQGFGCKTCSDIQNGRTTQDFLPKIKLALGDKYDYSKVVYKGWDQLVTLGCPIHGEFEKQAQYLLKGHGCNGCVPAMNTRSRRIPAEVWVQRFREAHGDKYDYSKVDVSGPTGKVTIGCMTHGDFEVDPQQLANGHECKRCAVERVGVSVETWIERFRDSHGDKYDYSKVVPSIESLMATIICPEHGEFQKRHHDHWTRKSGCKECSKRPKKPNQPRKNHLWTEAEEGHIRRTFGDMSKDVVMSGLSGSLTWEKVVARARKLGLTRARQVDMNWTTSDGRKMASYSEEDIEYLTKAYATKPKDEITSHLHRSWRAVCTKARELGLVRANIRTHQLAPLLDFSNVKNSYWLGFIMADGHLSKKGDLIVRLHNKDRDHLVALSQHLGGGHFIASHRNGDMASLCAMDKINGIALRNALGITGVKTYSPPPNLDFLANSDHRLAFMLGFSDGDGSVQFDHNGVFKSLRILIHGNWFPLFRDFFAQIAEDHDELNFNVNNTNARGNTSVYMGTKRSHRYLTEFGLMHDLPLMKRKWVAPTVLR